MLGYHAYDSTYAEREYFRSIKKSEYETIKNQWQVCITLASFCNILYDVWKFMQFVHAYTLPHAYLKRPLLIVASVDYTRYIFFLAKLGDWFRIPYCVLTKKICIVYFSYLCSITNFSYNRKWPGC